MNQDVHVEIQNLRLGKRHVPLVHNGDAAAQAVALPKGTSPSFNFILMAAQPITARGTLLLPSGEPTQRLPSTLDYYSTLMRQRYGDLNPIVKALTTAFMVSLNQGLRRLPGMRNLGANGLAVGQFDLFLVNQSYVFEPEILSSHELLMHSKVNGSYCELGLDHPKLGQATWLAKFRVGQAAGEIHRALTLLDVADQAKLPAHLIDSATRTMLRYGGGALIRGDLSAVNGRLKNIRQEVWALIRQLPPRPGTSDVQWLADELVTLVYRLTYSPRLLTNVDDKLDG